MCAITYSWNIVGSGRGEMALKGQNAQVLVQFADDITLNRQGPVAPNARFGLEQRQQADDEIGQVGHQSVHRELGRELLDQLHTGSLYFVRAACKCGVEGHQDLQNSIVDNLGRYYVATHFVSKTDLREELQYRVGARETHELRNRPDRVRLPSERLKIPVFLYQIRHYEQKVQRNHVCDEGVDPHSSH